MSLESFQQALPGYLASLQERGTVASIRHRCLDFLRKSWGVALLVSGEDRERPVFQGRVDAVLGRLVFVFKRDLDGSLAEAEAELRQDIAGLYRRDRGEGPYTGVACDGHHFRVYGASFDRAAGASLQPIGGLDLERAVDPEDAYLWLDGLLSQFRPGLAVPTSRGLVAAFGPDSPVFRRVLPDLESLFQTAKATPPAALRYRQWRSHLSVAYGAPVGDEALFIRHTYLSLIARLIARFFLEPGFQPGSGDQLANTIQGGYFREQSIDNFIEDDLFTWLLSPAVQAAALQMVRRLAGSLSCYDFRQFPPDPLTGLYQALVDPPGRDDLSEHRTPNWLAEYILSEELGPWPGPPRSVLDPCCGPGTFLGAAVRLVASASQQQGDDRFDTLLRVQNQVVGMDVHPLAVNIARVNYLLALGDLVQAPHAPVLLPVYLCNAVDLPGSTGGPEAHEARPAPVPASGQPTAMAGRPSAADSYRERVYEVVTAEPGVVFQVPDSVAADPLMLDWLFSRLPNYLKGAELRRRSQGGEEAVQEVLNAFYNYLVAPKPRTPIPEPLSSFAAEVMVGTARKLIQLYLEGNDHVWLFLLKNLPAAIGLARRKFDLMVGNPPWATYGPPVAPSRERGTQSPGPEAAGPVAGKDAWPAGHGEVAAAFMARCAHLYLNGTGRIGMVLPRAVLWSSSHQWLASPPTPPGSPTLRLERVVDLEQVSPLFRRPACVLVARSGPRTTGPVPGVVFKGDVAPRNGTWQQAKLGLTINETQLDGEIRG